MNACRRKKAARKRNEKNGERRAGPGGAMAEEAGPNWLSAKIYFSAEPKQPHARSFAAVGKNVTL